MTQAESRAGQRGDHDIIIVGAGTAGLPCAIAAANAGAKVLLIEKHTTIGGTTWLSGGTYSAANSRLNRRVGLGDSADAFYVDAMDAGRGFANAPLVRKIVDNAGPTLDWLLDLGLELQGNDPAVGPAHPNTETARTWVAKGGGKGFMAALIPEMQRQVQESRITLRLRTALKDLLRSPDGRAIGVEIESEDGQVEQILAPTVVLAAGGYGANREMIGRYNPGFENVITLCPPMADGSVILAAERAGAKLVNMDYLRIYPGGLPSVSNPWRCASLRNIVRMGRPNINGAVWVNTKGRRVINEDTPSSEAIREAFIAQWDKTLVVLFDSKVRDAAPKCPINNWDWEKFDKAAASGLNNQVVTANSWTELAGKCGVDPVILPATLKDWNGYVAQGQDPDFGRQPRITLDTPPLYGIITKGGLMLTMGGVKVDGDCRVLDATDRVIVGLYAVGEVVGMAQYMGHGGVSGFGDVAALALGRMLGGQLARAR